MFSRRKGQELVDLFILCQCMQDCCYRGGNVCIMYVGTRCLLCCNVLLILDSGDTPDEDLESNEASRIQKPWGDSHHFCPVILRNESILWPGNKEISLRYFSYVPYHYWAS